VAGLLKRYADEYKLAVVVTNQVGVPNSSLLSHTAALSLFLKGSYHACYYDSGPYRPLPNKRIARTSSVSVYLNTFA